MPIELLEARTLLAVNPIISEFMASNDGILKDRDGDYSDWIEIHNPDVAAVDLANYYLTDDAAVLTKWRLPSVTIAGGGYLVVFASGKDRGAAGAELHTNFLLDSAGEYLALVAPDGKTVVSDFGPVYPRQLGDISYGTAVNVATTTLVPPDAPVSVYIPGDASLGNTWQGPAFNDAGWIRGRTGVGFDADTTPPEIPGFTVRMVDVAGGINDIATAQRILNGPLPGGYGLQSDTTRDYTVVNHGPGGDFFSDQPLPNGMSDGEEYALRATANVFIPAGTWSISVGSDDGFMLKIPGVSFYNRWNENADNVPNVPADTLVFSSPRGHNRTSASFTVPAGGLSTTLTLDFYENGGGDDVELTVAPGEQIFSGEFVLLSDGVLPGWKVKTTSSTPPPNYNPLIGTGIQAQMLNHNASAYMRIPLQMVENPNDFDSLRLRIKYDDGFVAYLNGREIARRNAPDSLTWNAGASAPHADTDALVYEEINIPLPAGVLQAGAGTNVLAIHGLNEAANNTDFLIYPELQGLKTLGTAPRYFTRPTPGTANTTSDLSEVVADTQFSHDRGFYDAPFTLAITTATPGAEIRYTLDGTEPTATTGLVYNGPITLSGTTTIRAGAFKPGAISTNIDTQTYIFTKDVIHQSANGQAPAGWPTTWGSNVTDYGMDPEVVNNPLYRDKIEQALKSIPTFSIVMDLDDLFGPTGIYSNPGGDGRSWERPASVELINPDGTQGFHSNAGLRIRGGFSRSNDNPKHAFRLFFRDEYGDGKLDYPLFGSEGAQSFDGFDLRTFQNYSWSFQNDSRGIFIRDQLNRDLQLAMDQPGKRGNFYHLYINGQYWGLYNIDERAEASFGETYFGGDKEDYDVIKHEGSNVTATDGNMEAWAELWNGMLGDMTSNANYLKLQGKNPDGSRNPAYPVLLDVDNLIDYMLVIFYGGNFDSPLSWFMGDSGVNNFYAVRNRNGAEGFRFFIHDAEHTMVTPWSADVNEYLNADRTGPFYTMPSDPGSSLAKSNPQYMFQLLSANGEFRQRVADRMHKWFFNDGVLTPQKVTELFNKRKDEIYQAVICESARWGDAKRNTPFTRDNEWMAEINKLLTGYLPYRSQVVFNQLVEDGLYSDLPAPEFNRHGGKIPATFDLTISKPGGTGTIYYTLDGSDPRLFGGAKSSKAKAYSSPIRLAGNVTVKARVFDGESWSALTEASFYHDLSALRVTEIMYNPAEPESGPFVAQDFEFIELQNTGSSPIDLKGVSFTKGIAFSFEQQTQLAAGQRIVLVKNAAAFTSRYPGVAIGGIFTGSLDNNGEQIVLSGPAGSILDFSYKDGWYPITDGEGHSLVVQDVGAPLAAFSDKSNWRASDALHGGPGAADPGVKPGIVVISEVMASTSSPGGDWIELQNTTDTPVDISGWFLSDDPADLTKYQIQPGTVIPPKGYLVFTQAEHFGKASAPGVRSPFGLSALGDEVLLSNHYGADKAGGYREHVDFGASASEVSFGRYTKSTGGTDFAAMSAPTKGAANALPLVGPVIISEVMYRPAGTGNEFIELLNLTGADLPLYDPANPGHTWKFTEGVDYSFPEGAKLPAFGYALVVGIDPAVFRSTHQIPASVPIFGPYTGSLSDNGENLKLARPGAAAATGVPYITVDQVHYDNGQPWPSAADGGGASLSRIAPSSYGNDAGNWTAGPFGGSPGTAFLPPTAPSLLTAAGVNGSVVRLSWMDTSHSEDGFIIERSQDGINFSQVGTAGPSATGYEDIGLSPATFYSYRVRAYNNAGNSAYSNPFSVSTLGVKTTTLVGITDEWQYSDARIDLESRWIPMDYNDHGPEWKTGKGLFYFEDAALPAAKNTLLNRGPSGNRTPTFYFRKHFTFDGDPSSVSALLLRTIVDDGLVVYLNGDPIPVFALGVDTSQPVKYSTLANRTINDAVYEGPFELPVSKLRKGDNVIAVEVHQINLDSSDVAFGATLEAVQNVEMISADIVDVEPDPRASAVDSITIHFSEPVSGFGLEDLRLSRDGGSNLLTGAQTLTSNDGKTWTLGNLAPLSLVAGQYLLSLQANGSGIKGSNASHVLGADAVEMFRVTTSTITGTAQDDRFSLRVNGENLEVFTTIPPGSTPAYTIPLAGLTALSFAGGEGDDVFQILGVLPLMPTFQGGGGTDTIMVDAGVYNFAEDLRSLGIETITARATASVVFGASQHLSSLTLIGSARVALAAGGDRFISTGSLLVADNGVLDLEDNGLIVRGGSLSAVSDLIKSARGSGSNRWTGPGISSSAARSNALKGLVVLRNDRGNGSPIVSTLNGEAVSATDVLVKCSWNGDVNLDGIIDAADYFLVDSGYITQQGGYRHGDLNFDGVVDAADYFLVDSAYIGQTTGQADGTPQPITASAEGGDSLRVLAKAGLAWPFATAKRPIAEELLISDPAILE